jgi:ABC-type multidrug transport system ATPase subunit
LIIVDEPTAGLDPGERNRFYNLLADVGKEVIVILSTHIVDDVRELCTNMAVMNLGKVLYQGSPKHAIQELQGKVYSKTVERNELEGYANEYSVISNKMVAGQPLIHIYSQENPQNGFELVRPDLEDVFFSKINTTHTIV